MGIYANTILQRKTDKDTKWVSIVNDLFGNYPKSIYSFQGQLESPAIQGLPKDVILKPDNTIDGHYIGEWDYCYINGEDVLDALDNYISDSPIDIVTHYRGRDIQIVVPSDESDDYYQFLSALAAMLGWNPEEYRLIVGLS